MDVSTRSYDPETVGMLGRVLDDAWMEVQALFGARLFDAETFRAELAKRIVAAANEGERDPARLKAIALRAIDA